MKLEDQVCSLELAQRLKELGVKQESLWVWREYGHGFELELRDEDTFGEMTAAFTVAELGEIMGEAPAFKSGIC